LEVKLEVMEVVLVDLADDGAVEVLLIIFYIVEAIRKDSDNLLTRLGVEKTNYFEV
jgi:hypothetical protein